MLKALADVIDSETWMRVIPILQTRINTIKNSETQKKYQILKIGRISDPKNTSLMTKVNKGDGSINSNGLFHFFPERRKKPALIREIVPMAEKTKINGSM
ncbi:hypothetical protein [Antarctobacter heliothermus]|uniref:hypothetical protein n=1 Tax=Antarctobacter heliothermus TaxID=74033 RepID=UPI0011315F77|nr:hypothetical protein [Antarctobacter heliothermus]